MADTNNTSTMLVDELAALDPAHRREVASALRSVAEMFAEVRDGQDGFVRARRTRPPARPSLTVGPLSENGGHGSGDFLCGDCETAILSADAAPRGAKRGNSKFAAP